MGTIKDRNGIGLREAEGIKKRWQEYTEELYKKDLQDPDNHNGVITHIEPDILACEVKWALESITKDAAAKVLQSIYQEIWRTQQWSQDWKRSVFILIPMKGNAKECSDYVTIALISHAGKVISKFSSWGFNSIWTKNSQMFKLDLEKAEEPEIKFPTSVGSS